MCGITGVFSANSLFHELVISSVEKIKHRGPDNQTTRRVTTNLSFGHARLSIVDVNERANQPLFDENTGNCIIFNGEIYNYKELKKTLPRRQFQTNSDTEVLLYLLTDLPVEKALSFCNGMFAFAFWNNQTQELILGRDRIGKKPLFIYETDNSLFFSSEIKAFIPYKFDFKPNHTAVINFLCERTVGSYESTFFEGITQVKAGTTIKYFFNISSKLVKYQKDFWQAPVKNISIEYNDAVEVFKKLFVDSVMCRLSEEVPFAIMLSGGLDSSSIASVAAKYSNKEITSISAVYPGDLSDERKFADKVVEKYKNINPIWIEIKDNNFFSQLDKVIYHQETPIADGSMVAHSILMDEIANQGIKVVLSGNGGDEVLAGYPVFDSVFSAQKILEGNLKYLSMDGIYYALPNQYKNILNRIKAQKLNIFNSNNHLHAIYPRFDIDPYRHNDKINELLIKSLTHWSLPGFIWYEDRNSMASSIEGRCPFLDFRLVDFLLSISGEYKIDGEWRKKILRDSMIDILPNEIRYRKDKQGFHAPIKSWESQYTDFLNDPNFLNTFDYINFENFVGKPYWLKWRIFSLYKWYEIFFNKNN